MNEVYIYLLDDFAEFPTDFVSKNLEKLPTFRQEQCAHYRQELDKRNCVAAYLLLVNGLREQYGIAASVDFVYNEHGKPYLKDCPQIFFNISHCQFGVICAIADFEIGVDIQEVRPFDEAVAQRVCSESELSILKKADDPAHLLCRMWTAKESYAKAKGISVASILKSDFPEENSNQWDFGDYCLALCSQRQRMNPVFLRNKSISAV